MGTIILAVILSALFIVSLFVAIKPIKDGTSAEFFVGVEFAYSHNLNDDQTTLNNLKALVDKVKDYTNLFVIGIPEVSLNQTLLTESCNYISDAGLNIIVLFTDIEEYTYHPIDWTKMARQKYGEKLRGVYRIDEPGGKELEKNATERFLNPSKYDEKNRNYSGAAQEYQEALSGHINYFHQVLDSTLFTSDFGLYWFDYKAGYNTVFAEFVWNHSRQIAISLCRGAATAQGKDWGVIVTWMYDEYPYIESGQQLFDDLKLVYDAGAKYMVVFDYPNSTEYGILQEEHFDALKNFWNLIHNNLKDHGVLPDEVAYVLPQDYGFGFRRTDDTIWGLWTADTLADKVWEDVNKLINQCNSGLDIIYDDPEFFEASQSRYERLFFWNETIP